MVSIKFLLYFYITIFIYISTLYPQVKTNNRDNTQLIVAQINQIWEAYSGKNFYQIYQEIIDTLGHCSNNELNDIKNSFFDLHKNYFLKSALTKPLCSLQAHTDWVFSLAFNKSGTLLVSGSKDQTAKVWSLPEPTTPKVFKKHTGTVTSVCFDTTGSLVFSGSSDATIRLWDSSTLAEKKEFKGHINPAQVLYYTDIVTKQLIAGLVDGSLCVWKMPYYHSHQKIRAHRDAINMLTINSTGQYLASGADDYTIGLWDLDTCKKYGVLTGHTDEVLSVAFHPNKFLLASASKDCTLCIWDLNYYKNVQDNPKDPVILEVIHPDWISSISYNYDGTVLASGCFDHYLRLWDTDNTIYSCIGSYELPGWILSLAFNSIGSLLAAGTTNGSITLFYIPTRELTFDQLLFIRALEYVQKDALSLIESPILETFDEYIRVYYTDIITASF